MTPAAVPAPVRGRQSPRSAGIVSILLTAFIAGSCAPPPPSLRGLLAQGVAHAEIGQWAEALAAFELAVDAAPQEPVAAYDLAVAHYRTGDRPAARRWLERALRAAPPKLAARIELLRALLAYEDGDDDEELAAHREAIRLDPEEAAYHHALAQLHQRLRTPAAERAESVATAYQLWPENAYLASEFAQWALAQPQDEIRRRGLEVVEELVRASPGDEITAYFETGREQLAGSAGVPAAGVPVPLRIVFNLLRATKRFANDAAELQARLEAMPRAEPSRSPPPQQPSPEVRFELAGLLPELSLASGEQVLQVVRVDDALEELVRGPRQSGVAVAGDRGLYVLGRRQDAWRRLGELAGPVHQLLAGDVDDDERMELVLLAAGGLRVWDRDGSGGWSERPASVELEAAADLRRGLLIDFEHDGDLDLLAVDGGGRPWLVTHRGEAGWGPPSAAPLPVEVPIRLLASADLDGDHDQDLLLATDGELLTLSNWRQGEFALHARDALTAAPIQLAAFDRGGDGLIDVAVLGEDGITFFDGAGQARLERREVIAGGIAGSGLTAADVDLDGDQDMLVASASGIRLLANAGGRFELADRLVAEQPAAATLALDLDGDRDPDLLSWSGADLRTFRGHGAEGQRWIALRLRAPGRKVPRDGRGVRLQVAAGDAVQWLELERPHAIVGLGPHRPALVKATWPNGISEYLFEPDADAEHVLTLQLRVEGSCPFLYASDGDRLRFVTDILGLSPLGMLAAPGRYVPPDPEEYVRLPDWVRPHDGEVEIVISEELREVLYLDQAELVAVDAPRSVAVYNGERWLERPIRGLQLRLLAPLRPPASVVDHRGREVLELVAESDHRYLTNHVGSPRYQGAVERHRLTVELPPEVAAAEHPALVLVGWLHWGNTSTNVARSQDPGGAPLFPVLEVDDGAGGWRRTAVEVGLPAGKTKPVVVDLTGVWSSDRGRAGPPRLRITTDFEVYWDRIAVTTLRSDDDTPHRVHRLAPRVAELTWGGFSRWYRPAVNGPYLFDYGERRPYPWRLDASGRELALSWQEHEGFYTAFGAVTELLATADDRLVVLGSGEQVEMRFDVGSLPPLADGWRRTWFLHSEGWEKDGDPNVACSQTVEPLPRRRQRHDPCSGLTSEDRPRQGGAPRSRWVARDRLERRVIEWAG